MSHGQEVLREEDGALLGYVQHGGDGAWIPRTVFGYPLGPESTYDAAVAEVERKGLDCLTDRWWFRDESDGEWYTCLLQEVTGNRVRVSVIDLGHPDPYSAFTIDDPTPEKLRR